MAHEPFKGRRPIFIGDDVTDEAVFGIMPDLGGLAFSVGRHATGVADYFDEPRDVREWLAPLLGDGASAAPTFEGKVTFHRLTPCGPLSGPPAFPGSPCFFLNFFRRASATPPAPSNS